MEYTKQKRVWSYERSCYIADNLTRPDKGKPVYVKLATTQCNIPEDQSSQHWCCGYPSLT